MKKLTSANVDQIFRDCLFQDGEDTSKAVLAEGVVNKFGFHPERLAHHKKEIGELLLQLPENFQMSKGGGWSFLQACVTQDGAWLGHRNMEQLFALGLATEQAVCLMPREMWKMMPGSMPYYGINVPDNTTEAFPLKPDPDVTVDTLVPKPDATV